MSCRSAPGAFKKGFCRDSIGVAEGFGTSGDYEGLGCGGSGGFGFRDSEVQGLGVSGFRGRRQFLVGFACFWLEGLRH